MAKLSAADRQAQIVELINNNGTMKIAELADHFQVSRETIRRDMIALSNAGSAKKWFNGTFVSHDFNIQPVDTRLSINQDSKILICQEVFQFIPKNAVIFIDAGSTALCFAQLLSQKSGYTVITNSIAAANALANGNNQVIITGGSLNISVMNVTGMQTIEFLERIKIDVSILGSEGFQRHNGPSSNDFDDIQIKKLAVKNAMTSIVVADSRKASVSALMQYADWKDIDYFVTDDELPEPVAVQLRECTNVVTVSTNDI